MVSTKKNQGFQLVEMSWSNTQLGVIVYVPFNWSRFGRTRYTGLNQLVQVIKTLITAHFINFQGIGNLCEHLA